MCVFLVSNMTASAENLIVLDSSPVRPSQPSPLKEIWFATVDDSDEPNNEDSDGDLPSIQQLPQLSSSSAAALQPLIKTATSSGTPEKKRARQISTSFTPPTKRLKTKSDSPSKTPKPSGCGRVTAREKMAHNLEMKKEENRAAELALRLLEAENKKRELELQITPSPSRSF